LTNYLCDKMPPKTLKTKNIIIISYREVNAYFQVYFCIDFF
jgi:hypothetical protein